MINCKTYDRGHLRQAHLWHTAYIQMSEYKGFPSNQTTYISMKHNSNLSTGSSLYSNNYSEIGVVTYIVR